MILSDSTKSTPYIEVVPEKGLFTIKGRSMPENPASVYVPLIEFTKKYNENPQKATFVSFNLEYVNSTSLRYITHFIRTFNLVCRDCSLTFEWNSKGVEQVLPEGYSPKQFFEKLSSHLLCRKYLVVKVISELSSVEEKIEKFELN